MKVVYNDCFGGFGLSDAAMHRYAELKGIKLYPVASEYGAIVPSTYWTVPPHLDRAYGKDTLYARNIRRDDPHLVQVVEELGDAANGRCASLKIAEVPAGSRYRIDEYDGNESVMTVEDYEWEVAT